ncbi:MAG: hypothetical protein R6X35_09045 [Candidatus Krumholzibacteriia bacterium]
MKLTVISLRHDLEMGFDAAELLSFCEAHEVQGGPPTGSKFHPGGI